MNTRENETLRDYFLTRSIDLTPNGARRDSTVFYAPFSNTESVFNLCISVLTEAERQHMARLATDGLRSAFAQRRAFRRFCAAIALGHGGDLAGNVFDVTEKGRPYLRRAPDFRFSFSSCRFGMLGAWSATCELGIDIEDDTREIEALALAREFFTGEEAAIVEQAVSADRRSIFYQFWSLKEAALKSVGEGLPFGLDTFVFELLPTPRVVDAPGQFGSPLQFRAYPVGKGDFNAALVTQLPAGNVR